MLIGVAAPVAVRHDHVYSGLVDVWLNVAAFTLLRIMAVCESRWVADRRFFVICPPEPALQFCLVFAEQERRDDKRCDGSRITRRVQRSPILKSRRSDSALVFTASSRHRVNVTKGHMKRLSAQLHSPLGRPHMTKSSVMVS